MIFVNESHAALKYLQAVTEEGFMFDTILAATDGSEAAGRALDAAIDLSLKYSSRLYIAHVHLHGRPVDELERMAEIEHIVPKMSDHALPSANPRSTMLRELLLEAEHEGRFITKLGDLILWHAQERAEQAGVVRVEPYSTSGDYADGVLEAINYAKADLVVMGHRGLGKVRQILVGSVSNKVIQHCSSAVLLIK